MTLASVDVDGDGDLDLLVSDRKGGNSGVLWLENPGTDAVADNWPEHRIGAAGREVMFLDAADLDGDGQSEYLLFLLQEFGIAYSQFYYLTETGWKGGILNHPGWRYGGKEVHEMIKNGDIVIVDPRFKHLEIGGVHMQPSSNSQ